MNPLFSSLRGRLMWLVMAAGAPVVALVIVASIYLRAQSLTHIGDQAVAAAASISTDEQQELEAARQTLAVVAQLPALQDDAGGLCLGTLADLISRQRIHFANLSMADENGRVVCSAAPLPDASSVADEAFFQQAVETGSFAAGTYGVGPSTGQAEVDVGYPVVLPTGQLLGVVFAALDSTWISPVGGVLHAPAGNAVSLFDRNGAVLTSTPPPDRWTSRQSALATAVRAGFDGHAPARIEGLGPDGAEYLFGVAPLHDGSFVVVGLPAALAAEEQRRIVVIALLSLAGLGSLALGLGWWIGALTILRPVSALVDVARRLGTGDFSARSGVPYTLGELGELAQAFDDAAIELRDREEQIRQAQKLEALGLMAGGIAHDFNNLVTGVIGFSGLVLSRLPAGDPLRTYVAQIEAAGQRAANLTRQLLAFSRRQPLQPQVLDLNTVVADLEGLLRRALGEHIELITTFEPDLGHVEADRGQIEQVVVNLAVNARDAMPDGGRLTIKTANIVLGEEYARQHIGAAIGHHAMLSVTDTGTGMDEHTQEHIFEPFFTTKEPGKGTGLGLSTVYGIVSQSGGSIWVYSELGHGTTFRIYLPRVDRPISVSGPSETPDGLPKGTETILLVEDDKIVRSFTSTVLESLGYTVLVAGGSHDALPVIASRGASIDLLLTDLVMPGMSGRELAQRIMKQYPQIHVLYMSGFDPDTQVGQRSVPYGAPFLPKPFSPAMLSQKVREALRS